MCEEQCINNLCLERRQKLNATRKYFASTVLFLYYHSLVVLQYMDTWTAYYNEGRYNQSGKNWKYHIRVFYQLLNKEPPLKQYERENQLLGGLCSDCTGWEIDLTCRFDRSIPHHLNCS